MRRLNMLLQTAKLRERKPEPSSIIRFGVNEEQTVETGDEQVRQGGETC